ncbi:protein arginine N-methyltransferase 9-like isoform X2 [Phymastichus coffea]|uniref:protein arginine N-methyltransferase 9-like isoform X2 n=1 Tax=Phymastichus coffea TaxID=108790 RepID=UPI00273B61E9|nr:protein arginine N-methyltransferase 9-like isoform X2 [Phymastichus coffea]
MIHRHYYYSMTGEWGIQLERKNLLTDVIKCYKNSLELFPKNPQILNNFAAHLLRQEEYLRAIKYLKKALELDENFLPAVRNLQNAYSIAVDRWHFAMLNDKKRNEAFNKAIKKKVLLGYDTVLDIGTGTGILSLYAHDSGAKSVYACEYSPVMADIAKKVFHKNKADNIKLICKASHCLKIPENINERVKLIVTEIFDAAVFGELVIPTLIDAHKNLLATNNEGTIIPMSATLYIAAVESQYIRNKSSVVFNKSNYLGSLNFENIIIYIDDNYYDTESLNNVDVNYITELSPLLQINFNDLEELENFNKDGIKGNLPITCQVNGSVDALVVSFKLHLDEEIELDSSQKNSCWQFAIFPLIPQTVKQNDILILTAQLINGRLKCSCQQNNQNMEQGKFFYQLPRDVITFLNDQEYIASLIKVAKLKRNECIKSVYDTSPVPIYGLTVLKENSLCEVLYCQTDNSALKHFIEHIVNTNNINKKVYFVSDFSEITCTLDNIYVHNFDTKGELLDWGQQTYREIYSCLLSSSGTLLPERIFLMGQLVYSEELPKIVSVYNNNLQESNYQEAIKSDTNSELDDTEDDEKEEKNEIENVKSNSKTYKYSIAEYINKFKINQVFDLNSSLYNSIALSNVKTLTEMDEAEMKEEIFNFGVINVQKLRTVPNALICWYNIFITDDVVIETKRENSFMNHTAIVFNNEFDNKVLQGEDIKIKIQQMRDIVRISVV